MIAMLWPFEMEKLNHWSLGWLQQGSILASGAAGLWVWEALLHSFHALVETLLPPQQTDA